MFISNRPSANSDQSTRCLDARERLLTVEDLSVAYGSVPAVSGVSLEVRSGEAVALVGANGAGKTTLLRAISGLLPSVSGSIRLGHDLELTGMAADEIVHSRVVHVPEGRQVFGNMSVAENLLVGAYTTSDRALVAKRRQQVFELFPHLAEREGQSARTLSGGEQQMLAVGRGLMSGPKLLMLDEPSLGLAPVVMSEVFRAFAQIRELGVTILLVEQNSRVALEFADRGYVLETGQVALSGESSQLVADENVQRLFLGKGEMQAPD